MPFQFTCERCGVTFQRQDSYPKRYCSLACMRAPRPGIPGPDGSVLVPLAAGGATIFATIDAEDAEKVLAFNWQLNAQKYAARNLPRAELGTPNASNRLMHRFIMDAAPGQILDHANGDTLDNRRQNLRLASPSQNTCNSRMRKSISNARGVYQDKETGCWTSRISFAKTNYHLGSFATREEAIAARDTAARFLHGDFARLNRDHSDHRYNRPLREEPTR